MKKLISILTAVLILVSSAVSVSALDSVEYEFGEIAHLYIGDVDTDTALSSSDLTALKKILLKAATPVNEGTADLNYDNSINIIDLVRLKKKLSGQVIASFFSSEADALKAEIINAQDSIPSTVTGTVYYVSAEGSTSADGTAENPYSYAQLKAKEFSPASGDAVLLKRGDTYRGRLVAVSGVYYGAYGEGAKPCVYGSAQNYSSAEWTAEGDNIYSLSGFDQYNIKQSADKTYLADVGIIVFNNGENVGYKRASKEEATAQYDFYYDAESGTLYLYTSKAPAEYDSIEIGINTELVKISDGASNITVENLTLKYTGGHGIYVGDGSSNITVKNCEIGYVGGSYLQNGVTRFGNGIEFWRGCDTVVAENNWIYEIYDSGITHQGGGEYTANNITVRKNLIEYCGMGSVEYWMSYTKNDDGTYNKCTAENVTYADNIMRFAGYGFGGEQRPDKEQVAHIRSDITCPNDITNFTITGNIFDQSSDMLVTIGSTAGKYPVMSGNKYAQSTEGELGTFASTKDCDFDLFVEYSILNVLKDSNSKVYWY